MTISIHPAALVLSSFVLFEVPACISITENNDHYSMRRGNTLDKLRLDGLKRMIKLSEMDLSYLIHSVRDARAIGVRPSLSIRYAILTIART